LNGARQMLMLMLDAYEKPIHTPVKELRPARETCEKCHWPEKFYGRRMDIYPHFRMNVSSTPYYNTLNLKIDTGREATKAGIHWHIAAENEVRYTSVDDERETMIRIEARQPDGSYRQYRNRALRAENFHGRSDDVRIMDCVDCHNRATHIYEDPEAAVDRRIAKGHVDRSLPFIKREMLHAITINYTSGAVARDGIRNHLYGFYRREFPGVIDTRMAALDAAVESARAIYARNVHHYMDIDWNTYPSFIHHRRGTGCFRCHNETFTDDTGAMIPFDCTTCHSILAYESPEPFSFIRKPDEDTPQYPMHRYLHDEFFNPETGLVSAAPDVVSSSREMAPSSHHMVPPPR